MIKLSLDEYQALRAGADVLERDAHGDKVLRLKNGNIFKMFRRKRLISSAAWKSYAQRFADNCAALKKLGIPVPEMISVLKVPPIQRDAVLYVPIPGRTIREIRRSGLSASEDEALKKNFQAFVDRLHALGIYFRSLHLGNIVLTPSGELGLIDVADVKIYRPPLNAWLKARNLKRIATLEEDKAFVSK